MPKNSKVVKVQGVIKKFKVPATLRIGTRSSGVSAHRMSTDALKAVVADDGKKRYHRNAQTVLTLRGMAV